MKLPKWRAIRIISFIVIGVILSAGLLIWPRDNVTPESVLTVCKNEYAGLCPGDSCATNECTASTTGHGMPWRAFDTTEAYSDVGTSLGLNKWAVVGDAAVAFAVSAILVSGVQIIKAQRRRKPGVKAKSPQSTASPKP